LLSLMTDPLVDSGNGPMPSYRATLLPTNHVKTLAILAILGADGRASVLLTEQFRKEMATVSTRLSALGFWL